MLYKSLKRTREPQSDLSTRLALVPISAIATHNMTVG
jgi:hypothetical protein